jgi:hypothetical protein
MSCICIFPVQPKQQTWSKYYLFCTQLRETIFINLEVDSEKSQENHRIKIRKISEFVVDGQLFWLVPENFYDHDRLQQQNLNTRELPHSNPRIRKGKYLWLTERFLLPGIVL